MNKIKTVLIFILLILFIYQVYSIWFVTAETIRTSFWSFLSPNKEGEKKNLVTPNKIIVSFGNKQYTVVKSTIMESKIIEDYIEAIYDKILKSNVKFATATETLDTIYAMKSIILSYDTEHIDSKYLYDLFLVSNKNIVNRNIHFDTVIIRPITGVSNGTEVYLLNSKVADSIYKTFINDDTTEVYGFIEELRGLSQTNIYICTLFDAVAKFFSVPRFLLAFVNDASFLETQATLTNPFTDSDAVEEYANRFFENPRAKWKINKNQNNVIYGDAERSVKIELGGYVEYTERIDKNIDTTLTSAITIANRFLTADDYTNNEFYISQIRKNDRGWKINYNYKIDDFEYVLSEKLKEQYAIESPIEVIVLSNEVVSYRRLVRSISFGMKPEAISFSSYIDVLENLFVDLDGQLIEDMLLAYYEAEDEVETSLSWIVKTKEKIFSRKIGGGE